MFGVKIYASKYIGDTCIGVDFVYQASINVTQAGRRLVRSLLTLRAFVVDVMDLRTGNRNEDDS